MADSQLPVDYAGRKADNVAKNRQTEQYKDSAHVEDRTR